MPEAKTGGKINLQLSHNLRETENIAEEYIPQQWTSSDVETKHHHIDEELCDRN